MPTHRSHAGDTLTPIGGHLRQKGSDGTYSDVDLSGKAVTFKMEDEDGTSIVSGGSCTVADATGGLVYYAPAAADVAVPGTYNCWFIVTAGGKHDTYPVDGDESLTWEIL